MKQWLAAIIVLFCVPLSAEKIKLYTFFTPSHTVLKDEWFVPTLQDEDIELIIKEYPQECPSGKVWQDGWQKSMLRKVDMVIEAIHDNWGKVFIYADIDIQFFKPFAQEVLRIMGDKDFVIQRENPSGVMCAGFFAVRANEKMLQLWHGVRKHMIKTNIPSDQRALNILLRKGKSPNRFNIVWDFLPGEFFGGGTFTGRGWNPGTELYVPKDIVLHHANWTVGVRNKIEQLEYVRAKVAGNSSNELS